MQIYCDEKATYYLKKIITMNRFLVLALICTILSGCAATRTQHKKNKLVSLVSSLNRNAFACRLPIRAKLKYIRIYEKLGVDPKSDPTYKQLSDNTIIIDSDIQLGLDWYGEMQYCLSNDIQRMGRIDPELAIIRINGLKQITELVDNIVSSPQTYGAINQRVQVFRESQGASFRSWFKSLDLRLQAMERQELLETRRKFLADVGQIAISFVELTLSTVVALSEAQANIARSQEIYAASHPTYISNPIITTNCNWLGGYLTCQSF